MVTLYSMSFSLSLSFFSLPFVYIYIYIAIYKKNQFYKNKMLCNVISIRVLYILCLRNPCPQAHSVSIFQETVMGKANELIYKKRVIKHIFQYGYILLWMFIGTLLLLLNGYNTRRKHRKVSLFYLYIHYYASNSKQVPLIATINLFITNRMKKGSIILLLSSYIKCKCQLHNYATGQKMMCLYIQSSLFNYPNYIRKFDIKQTSSV